MAILDTTQEQPAATPPAALTGGGRRRGLRLSRSKKMTAGLIILGFFLLLAVIGPWIAPYKPTGLGPLVGPPLHGATIPSQQPGGKHWLGQTNIGGDVLSQLLA